MRISDWSSDVCSSDLLKKALSDGEAALSGKQADEKQRLHAKKAVKAATTKLARLEKGLAKAPGTIAYARKRLDKPATEMATTPGPARDAHIPPEIGRASCRERVCQYVSISVVAVSLQKKKH